MPFRLLIVASLLALPGTLSAAAELSALRIGFDGYYKLGCWTPVAVTVTGLQELEAPQLQLIAVDGDGSPAVVTQSLTPEAGPTVVQSLLRIGRRKSVIIARLTDGQRVVAQIDSGTPGVAKTYDFPSTASFVLAVDDSQQSLAPGMVSLAPSMLPEAADAYQGISTLVLRTSGIAPSDLTEQAAQAIYQWVEHGGRLVLIGGANSAALLAEEGPLNALAPGSVREIVRLAGTGMLEDYADTDTPLAIPRTSGLPACRLENVQGQIELYAGGRATDMPLVVRSMVGFGQVTWVAFDPFLPAFEGWKGRQRMLELLVPDRQQRDQNQATAQMIGRAYDDLAGALYVKLGSAFAGVVTVSVITLVMASVLYLALLGPGAYYFGKRVVGSMQSAWITFPVIAVLVGAGAWAWGRAATGTSTRLNQIQLVDIHCQSGQERGFAWAQLFSPTAQRYNLACSVAESTNPTGYLTWWGLPGRGLGGMQTTGGSLLAGQVHYPLSAQLDGLTGVPINRRASKALTARWQAQASETVTMDLTPTSSGLVEGVIVNETSLRLTNVRLLVGGWAWRLGDLPPGAVASVDISIAPSRWRTMLLTDFGRTDPRGGADWGSTDRLSAEALLSLMMFRQAMGGPDAAPLENHYAWQVDLSHALRIGHPVLLGQAERPRASLTRDGQTIDPDAPAPTTFYRFLGPQLPPNDQPIDR